MSSQASFTAVLPLPPSTNNLFATSKRPDKNGRHHRFPSAAYAAWQTEAGIALNQQQARSVRGLAYQVSIGLPVTCRADIDNMAKPVLDLLVKHQVMTDDSRIRELAIRKMVCGPECVVTVTGIM